MTSFHILDLGSQYEQLEVLRGGIPVTKEIRGDQIALSWNNFTAEGAPARVLDAMRTHLAHAFLQEPSNGLSQHIRFRSLSA